MKQIIANIMCLLSGHKWKYRDYSGLKNERGDYYDFRASRACQRCKQNEYLYEELNVEQKKNYYDIKKDFLLFKQLPALLRGRRQMDVILKNQA